MKRYNNYKLSGIQWIGEIPKHWELKRIKHNAKTLAGGTPATGNSEYWDGDIPWLNSGKVQDNIITYLDIDKYITKLGLHKSATKMIKPNSVLIALTGATCGNIGFLTFDSTANQSVVAIENDSTLDSKFLFYLLLSQREQILIEKTGGAQSGINEGDVKNLFICFPPKEEQTDIANYLDEKTAQIDKLISNKQKLIELLKEERTTIINEAVNGEGKNWERKKLKYVAKLKSGKGITSDNIKPEGDFPVYGGNGLRGYTSTFTHNGKYVLIGRQGALCGNINYANGKFFASEHAVVVSILIENEFVWLGELLRSMNLNQYSQASAQPGLSVEKIQNLLIPVPNEKEKDFIVQHIQSENQRIDKTISIIEKEIELMQEYRTALISEAVTGKLKITN